MVITRAHGLIHGVFCVKWLRIVVSWDSPFCWFKSGRQIFWTKDLIWPWKAIKTHLILEKLNSSEISDSSDWKIESEDANVSSPESPFFWSLIGLNCLDLSLLMSFWKLGAARGLEFSKLKPFTFASKRFVASFAEDLATASSPSSEAVCHLLVDREKVQNWNF